MRGATDQVKEGGRICTSASSGPCAGSVLLPSTPPSPSPSPSPPSPSLAVPSPVKRLGHLSTLGWPEGEVKVTQKKNHVPPSHGPKEILIWSATGCFTRLDTQKVG